MPETMRAVQILGDKSSPQLSFSRAFPVPSDTDDEVLIRVSAAGVTADEVSWPEVYESNRVPGHDVAGTIVALGPAYSGALKPGDTVFAMIKAATRSGGQADYVAVGGAELAAKPARLTFAEAAALPIPLLTAWEALRDHARLQKGQTVLVTGASGAVGRMLVQVASRVLGAEVIALASAASHSHLKTLGAGRCVDYRAAGWEASLGALDAVVDTVGGEVYTKSRRSLRRGGVMVTVADPPPKWAFGGGKPEEELADDPEGRFVYFVVTASGEALGKAAALLESGVLEPLPVVEFEAERALEAWKYAGGRGKEGKAVIKFD
ncbi:Alcohol dehydrogenase superfamily, zinc-type [Cordyceps fumosorosea ARSEF 2679]|uniref:Alcohol dehydrogenase superfamily, zinc-type n=1 Tax=Cordyceps fumosorosea (strain ARSEF 2679) TaxID=1081104 RepID=A0A167LHM7_CORFA|nr:Alcohol dehydrogenase superfamily, zinc-type [Cordyceps fumosorosea ARSEF 2679]OAA53104.1 Alcohol dehydrogenase superfamily, zinc-type [Cordyceps fumosorosea ARSEF 2679]